MLSTLHSTRSTFRPEESLRRQLRYIQENVPFYRSLRLHPECSLEEFPLVEKGLIRENYAQFISDEFKEIRPELASFLTRDSVCTPSVFEVAFNDEIIVEETSGSSDVPIRCPKSRSDRFHLGVGLWRSRARVDPGATPARLAAFVHFGCDRPPFDYEDDRIDNLKRLYGWLAASRFRWIHSEPGVLQDHVATFRKEGWFPVLPDVRFIESTGWYLREDVARDLGEVFGATVLDQYGTIETWGISLTCEHRTHYVNEQNVYVEIVDDDGRAMPPDAVGRIVVTSLQERLLPFIRYVTGDFGQFVSTPCCPHRGGSALRLVDGRAHTVIQGFPGRVFGNVFFSEVATKTRAQLACDDLFYLRVFQVGLDEFRVHTNAIPNGPQFLETFAAVARGLVGRELRFHHAVDDDTRIQSPDRSHKPWVFRWDPELRVTPANLF